MGSITVIGGNAAQQSLITSSHAAAATALGAAITAAGQGGASFATWFGADTAAAHTAVTATLTAMQTALSTDNFSYDLTATEEQNVYVPIVVSIIGFADGTVSLIVNADLWTLSDTPSAKRMFVLGLVHQLCLRFGGAQIMDRWGVVDSYTARLLAQADPAAAQAAPFCYMFFVAAYLPT